MDVTQRAPELVRQAERALREPLPLEYQRPFAQTPYERSRAPALFLDACRGGDKPSCWIAMTLAEANGWREIAPIVEENCRAGDHLSCRALPSADTGLVFENVPGWAGRSAGCHFYDDGTVCDLVALRRECAAEFAISCYRLMFARPVVPDWDAIRARVADLADVGCRAGIIEECRIVLAHSPGDTLFAAERLCLLAREHCSSLSHAYLRRGDPMKARDTLERGCQYHAEPEMTCLELAQGYLENTYLEPVPGRRQALVDWSCARFSPTIRPVVEHCKRATPGLSTPPEISDKAQRRR